MERNKVMPYTDTVIIHPEYTDEEMERVIEEAKKETEALTEWPMM